MLQVLAFGESWKEKTTVEVDLATQNELDVLLDAEARHCFDLSNDMPIRMILARVEGLDHLVLAFNVHHTAFDAWSWKLFLRDLTVLYQASEHPDCELYFMATFPPLRRERTSAEVVLDFRDARLR
jgi:NRPS condensation-like uncharacterized protein